MLKQKIPNSSENRYSDTNTTTNTNGSNQYLLNSYYALDTGLTLTTTLRWVGTIIRPIWRHGNYAHD